MAAPANIFPRFNEWLKVYHGVKDFCDFASATAWLREHPCAVNNRKSLEAWTILHQAAFWGLDEGMIQVLKDLGADPNLKDGKGKTALNVANDNNNAITAAAIQKIFTLELAQLREQLAKAANGGDFITVKKLLVQHPYLIHNQSATGWTVLHQAAFHGVGPGVFRLLRSLGASEEVPTYEGKSVREIILEYHGDRPFVEAGFKSIFDVDAAHDATLKVDSLVCRCGVDGQVIGKVKTVTAEEVVIVDRAGVEVKGAPWRFCRLPEEVDTSPEALARGLERCAICDEPSLGQPLTNACQGDKHVLCSDCLVNFLWAGFTSGDLPPKCGFCKAEMDVVHFRASYSRSLSAKFQENHPGLTFFNFIDNFEQKIKAEKAAPISWDTLDKEAKKFFDDKIAAGELMLCCNPDCKQLFDKLSGCNWVQCYFCKTEHCWQTKKLRHDQFGLKGCGGGHSCH